MISDKQQLWILVGYELFAKHGPEGLNVEFIARNVGKSKSSFYHLFAEMEIFTRILLEYHLERVRQIAEQERQCKNINPELINVLLDSKIDLLFSRQLRINRAVKIFRNCYEQANIETEEAFIQLWTREIGLQEQSKLAYDLYELAQENFYLQLSEETLTFGWLSEYFTKLQEMVVDFKKSPK